jgi:hypothetical protein
VALPGGATVPPLPTLSPPIVPLPISVPPELRNTVEASEPFTLRAPALILVGPAYVLAPDSVSVPAPILVSPPLPDIVPENVVLVLSLPVVSMAEPSVTLPAPASEPMV